MVLLTNFVIILRYILQALSSTVSCYNLCLFAIKNVCLFKIQASGYTHIQQRINSESLHEYVYIYIE
ncbi:unnamed protein product [Boreogadus saida]